MGTEMCLKFFEKIYKKLLQKKQMFDKIKHENFI